MPIPAYVPMFLQYQNASKFTALLTALTEYLTIPIDEYFNHYFNLETADTQGLINWGVILNQPNNIIVPTFISTFGFDTGIPPSPLSTGYPQNFNNGNFAITYTAATLTNDQYRILLQFVYSTYVTNNSFGSCVNIINTYVAKQYPNMGYKCTVVDGNMHFIYQFNYNLQPFEIALFRYNQKLPKPGGIGYTVTWNA